MIILLAALANITGLIATSPESGAVVTTCRMTMVRDDPYHVHPRFRISVRTTNLRVKYVTVSVTAWQKNYLILGDSSHLEIATPGTSIATKVVDAPGQEGLISQLRCGIFETEDASHSELWSHPFAQIHPTDPH
jgi:hypothetical protein